MTKNPDQFPHYDPVPHPKERYTRKDAYFWAGDQPVFLAGPAVFNYTLGALPFVRELGFNVIEVSTGPSSVFPTSDQPTRSARAIDYNSRIKTGKITDILDQCAKLGLKVDLGLTAHFMPKWFFEKYPEAKNQAANHMMPYDIEYPDLRKFLESWLAQVMPTIANKPALNSIFIANEPAYLNPDERNVKLFRDWLKKKYKTIDALNKTWHTHMADLSDIKPGKGKAYRPVGVTTQPSIVDWYDFSTQRIVMFLTWMKDQIHKYDPTVPVTVKLYNATFNPNYRPVMRFNEEPVEDAMDIIGYDGGTYPFSNSYSNFLNSLSPDKPVQNSEFHYASPPQRAHLDIWKEAMRGTAALDWWCWHTKPAFSNVPSYAVGLYDTALAKMQIQRLLPQVMAFNKLPRAPMAILYPNPVQPRLVEYFKIHDLVNPAIHQLGYACDYVSEKRAAMGRLKDYHMLMMPQADFISDATYKKVEQFVDDGGIAVIVGDPPAHDRMGRPRNASFFQYKKHPSFSRTLKCGATAHVFPQGKGKVYVLTNLPMTDNGKKLSPQATGAVAAFLEKVFQTELPKQPVVIRRSQWSIAGLPPRTSDTSVPYRTISWTDADGGKSYLTWLVNGSLDEDMILKPTYNFNVGNCTDLITGEKIDPKHIVLPPLGVRMLKFTIAP